MILDNPDWIPESGKVLQQENFRSELEKIQFIEQSKSKKKFRKELVHWVSRISTSIGFENSELVQQVWNSNSQ